MKAERGRNYGHTEEILPKPLKPFKVYIPIWDLSEASEPSQQHFLQGKEVQQRQTGR